MNIQTHLHAHICIYISVYTTRTHVVHTLFGSRAGDLFFVAGLCRCAFVPQRTVVSWHVGSKPAVLHEDLT